MVSLVLEVVYTCSHRGYIYFLHSHTPSTKVQQNVRVPAVGYRIRLVIGNGLHCHAAHQYGLHVVQYAQHAKCMYNATLLKHI